MVNMLQKSTIIPSTTEFILYPPRTSPTINCDAI